MGKFVKESVNEAKTFYESWEEVFNLLDKKFPKYDQWKERKKAADYLNSILVHKPTTSISNQILYLWTRYREKKISKDAALKALLKAMSKYGSTMVPTLKESVNEAFKKGDLVMYDGKGLHGRKSGTRGKVIKIGGGKATMKYGKAKDQVEVVPVKALRNPLTQQHFKSSAEMKKFSNDLNESFSDGSPQSQERIKKYSEVLGYSLVGELDEPSFKLREAKLLRFFNEFIAKQGEKWVVKSKAGKTLGTHATKDEAIKQLAAVEISKKKN